MNFLKENWFRITIVLLVLAIAGLSFYWYEWRPYKIRKECALNVGDLIKNAEVKDSDLPALEYVYSICIRVRGLEK